MAYNNAKLCAHYGRVLPQPGRDWFQSLADNGVVAMLAPMNRNGIPIRAGIALGALVLAVTIAVPAAASASPSATPDGEGLAKPKAGVSAGLSNPVTPDASIYCYYNWGCEAFNVQIPWCCEFYAAFWVYCTGYGWVPTPYGGPGPSTWNFWVSCGPYTPPQNHRIAYYYCPNGPQAQCHEMTNAVRAPASPPGSRNCFPPSAPSTRRRAPGGRSG